MLDSAKATGCTDTKGSDRLHRPTRPHLDRTPTFETGEPTWSANATMHLGYAFGSTRTHYVGLSFSQLDQHGVLALRVHRQEQDDGSYVFNLDSKHYVDGWFEAGASTSMRLSDTVYLYVLGP